MGHTVRAITGFIRLRDLVDPGRYWIELECARASANQWQGGALSSQLQRRSGPRSFLCRYPPRAAVVRSMARDLQRCQATRGPGPGCSGTPKAAQFAILSRDTTAGRI